MNTLRKITVAFAVLGVVMPLSSALAGAQDAPRSEFRTLAELNESYRHQGIELDRKKLADLAALAGRLPAGPDAEAAYREAFDLTVARGFFADAEPIAKAYLARETGEPETLALAGSISLIARADRGDFAGSLADFRQFLTTRAAATVPRDRRLSPALLLAVGEAYLQRLIRSGQYETAKQVCSVVTENQPEDPLKAHFVGRLRRLALLGQPAPAISGVDIDGKPISLADLKGKVVLVDFWATWCPPCASAFPHLRELAMEHKEKGLVVLGVNLDTLPHEGVDRPDDSKVIRARIRRFLLDHRASWPNVVGSGAQDAAQAYHADQIPVNFLIDRDGKIRHVELGEDRLAKVAAHLLGSGSAK